MAAVNEMRLPDFSVCLQAQVGIMPLKGKCIPRVQRVVLIIIANCPSPHTNPTNSALSLAMHYILASLVKGEVLSPEKIRATTGWIVPPSLATINPFQNRTITIAFRRGVSLLLPLRRILLLPQPS